MSDLSATITPKSDQLNADDLITAPLTIRITKVTVSGGEQPVEIYYDGDNGKPYKPGKSMRRVLVMAWGSDGSAYIGRSLTLYRDEEVTYGKVQVGGIRISHMSHIAKPVTIALATKRGQRIPYTVQPLVSDGATLMAAAPVNSLEALQSWWQGIGAANQKLIGADGLAELKQKASEVSNATN